MAASSTSVASTTVDELTNQVERLKAQGEYRLARQAVERFINDHPEEAEIHGLNDLLASLITVTPGAAEADDNDWRTRLRSAQVYAETDKNTVPHPQHAPGAPRQRPVLDELAKLADTYPATGRRQPLLESMPINPAIEAALAQVSERVSGCRMGCFGGAALEDRRGAGRRLPGPGQLPGR